MLTSEQVLGWLERIADSMRENRGWLTDLDAAIGDADHGINMERGFNKVLEKLPSADPEDIGSLLKTTGMTLMSSVGGASGPLYGTFFLRLAAGAAGKSELSDLDVGEMLAAGVRGIQERGRPQPGDKTMYDAWAPALVAIEHTLQNGSGLLAALEAGVAAAEEGVQATIPMQARKGRASYLGERSIGHQDPGATSSWLMLKSLLGSVCSVEP